MPSARFIWFGVLLCVTMQKSFMHPPFGFALFYLRGIAPKAVKSSDIYLGALPWVGLQLIMVAIVIFWPGLVTSFVDKPVQVDLDSVRIEIPGDAESAPEEAPPSEFSTPQSAPQESSTPASNDPLEKALQN